MGIIKISDLMHDELRAASDIYCRSINAQAEYWLRIGRLAERNPALSYSEIVNLLHTPDQAKDTLTTKEHS
ncbi:MAG: ParD-like family protein [Yersiniaceae bacterium]|uniref:ParD-like family protein n=1 Tax=Chimaeribacter coloradensis TaxID=2060068 RepID=A0A2N5ECG9_9GAMM|nr:ParD-like family protein [Chimaeribacter coloradensis]MDU6411444.1 ParD-like family protein [Yersiniaceae bacterium]PLR40197.1 hypothetical protein CYR32_00180 [Chimaeribacter coloradensis]